jgi:hypothetical protein
MAKAKKKPVVIDFLWSTRFHEEVKEWVESFGDKFEDHFISDKDSLKVKTLEGTSYDVSPTEDLIIRGVKGEYYPCKRDIFEQTYDKL